MVYRNSQIASLSGGLGRTVARKREGVRRLRMSGPLGMAFIDDGPDYQSLRRVAVSPAMPIPALSPVSISPALTQPGTGVSVSPAISNYVDQTLPAVIGPPASGMPVLARPLPATAVIDAPGSPTNPMATSVDDSVNRMYPLVRTDQPGPLASGMPAATTGNYVSAPGVGTPQQSTDSSGNPIAQGAALPVATSNSWEWIVLAVAALLVLKA